MWIGSRAGALAIQSPADLSGYPNMECIYCIFKHTSTHSSNSGTNLLGRGWAFFFAGVAPSERQRLLIAVVARLPVLSVAIIEPAAGQVKNAFRLKTKFYST